MPTDTRKGKTPCKTRQAHHPKTMSQTSPFFEQRNDPNPVFVQKAPLLAKGSSRSGVFSSLHGLTEKALPPAISIPSRISLGQHCILWLPIQQLLRRHPSFFLMCCKHRNTHHPTGSLPIRRRSSRQNGTSLWRTPPPQHWSQESSFPLAKIE